jgi:hypothetical protein
MSNSRASIPSPAGTVKCPHAGHRGRIFLAVVRKMSSPVMSTSIVSAGPAPYLTVTSRPAEWAANSGA